MFTPTFEEKVLLFYLTWKNKLSNVVGGHVCLKTTSPPRTQWKIDAMTGRNMSDIHVTNDLLLDSKEN